MDKKMAMAYALGMAYREKTGEHSSIDLGEFCEDWKNYTIVEFGSDHFGPEVTLYYEGSFGNREVHALMMRIEYGFSVEHTVRLITQAIICHQAERKKNKT